MSNTTQLELPYLQPSQAQKHVTHNEALRLLDALVQLRVQGFDLVIPPPTPAEGDVFALGTGATGGWAGQDNMLAVWDGTAWGFVAPKEGWRSWGLATQELRIWDGGAWTQVPGTQDNLHHLGINTTADATNRLSVSADASLLSHDGSDHRVVVNKAALGDTSALLFQSDWVGHAEIGLTGSNDLSFKVSADGSSWNDALVVNATSGHVSGAAVQASPTDITPGRLARADYAYSPGNVVGTVAQLSGVPTGAVIEGGSNANGDYIRFADGTQICSSVVLTNAGSAFTRIWPAMFIAAPRLSLAAGGTSAITATSASNSTMSVDLYAFDTTGSQIAAYVGVVAMGRWF
ncbi:DUF2793 domain-containing protein [Marinovum sp. 2_MG-2023]|uniref:DUF2793 domain-containing protein n=1 Tax=unclassified Marinovum TaxID=2647166 RepID=UPI0026E44ECA|nr:MULTISPECIES: DUF2793 domain-containing protein [unclassified Marinovum]MDO6732729.1 DUF2793 domain-containing protein [Marinovum sp. 2_MG-2023]MDO6782003.1 DUF2793 domain-containing protein [Marinovum sp. 1_MG-2023]